MPLVVPTRRTPGRATRQPGPARDHDVAHQRVRRQDPAPDDQRRHGGGEERFSVAPAQWLLDFSQAMPTALSGLADRAAFRLASGTVSAMNLMVSNVPGPRLPLYILGSRIVAHYPLSVITHVSGGVNITLFSYDGFLDVGIVVDRDMVPDVWDFIDYMRDALAEL
ncbi:DUF1298 domain-containing protein [Herbidospora sp. NEAU-GS84]|uniref:DUF1298 domain-containing protein n=2 Tax=Herbidospora solisilvae TaxID=2696284 RepID=A0A7C9JHM7_9ACTN|nr:DUF1298 domain-containing protein [Herbidospora solisilvae]